jgi:DNA polymerase-3 subunit gamma/tau
MSDSPGSPTGPPAVRQAIYRRFRAQTFSQIVGQGPVVETLRNAIRLDRLGHAFLFIGPRGTGKTSMARILAKAVNCTNLADGEPCDRCPSCVAIREGRALDVVELDAASNNRVDDMRELVPRVYTAPSDLRRKVFIIDEVQRIKEGWDVLLKTLEEPPDSVLFVFCTTDPGQIRPAVVSRLQRFTFRPLPETEIEGKLRRILAEEGRQAGDDAVALIAHLAAGGMRDAESMLDQVLASAADPITADAIRQLLGLADEETVDAFVHALVDGDVAGGVRVLDALEAEGRDLVSFGEQLVRHLRRVLVDALTIARPTPAERERSAALAGAARRLTGIDASRAGLGGYRWQLELCLLSAAADAPLRAEVPSSPGPPSRPAAPSGPAAATRAASATGAAASTRAAASTPHAEPVAAVAITETARSASSDLEGPALLEAVLRDWPAIVAQIGRNPANRPVVAACRPVDVQDGVLLLGFPEDQAFLRDVGERKRVALEEGVAAVIGRTIGVRCVVANVESAPSGTIAADDLVAHARRIFEGELVGVDDVD